MDKKIDCPDCKDGYTTGAGGIHWCNTCNRGDKGHNKGTVFLCSYEFIEKIIEELKDELEEREKQKTIMRNIIDLRNKEIKKLKAFEKIDKQRIEEGLAEIEKLNIAVNEYKQMYVAKLTENKKLRKVLEETDV